MNHYLILVLSLLVSEIHTQYTCSGTQTLTAASGTFNDGSGSSDYGNNLYCTWIISPEGADYVQVTINSFSTASDWDQLTFIDGLPGHYGQTLTGPLSGYITNIPVVYSTGPSMYLVFSTDSAGTSSGWSVTYAAKQGQPPTCSGYIPKYLSSGSISDGSGSNLYTNDLNCEWLIQVPSGNIINISVPYIDTLSTDQIYIYDGPNTNYQVIAEYYGTSVGYFVFSTFNSILVKFFSAPNSPGAGGWTLSWTNTTNPRPTCGGTYYQNNANGEIVDGSGSATYSNNLYCKYVFAPFGVQFLEFSIVSFFTEADHDYVTIYDGPDTTYPIVQKLSGSLTPSSMPPFYTTTNQVLLLFTSDLSTTYDGWDIAYQGKTGTVPTCGGRTSLTSNSGSFSDGSGSNNYTPGLNCQWLVTVSSGVVNISVSTIAVQPGDKVIIYDGSTISSPVLAVLTGNTAPTYFFFTSSTTALVSFTSASNSSGSAGWTMNWKNTPSPKPTCGGQYQVTAASGSISDGNTTYYTNNLNCQWLITPAGAQYIQFDLFAFDTESGHDYVTVYDGSSPYSTPIAEKLSGNFVYGTIPPFFTGSTALLTFTTDSTNDYNGWIFNYTSKTGTKPTCGGRTYVTSTSGSVSDGSGSNNYTPGLHCQWFFNTSSGIFNFSVTDLGTLSSDKLTIYDGPSTSSPVLVVLSGNSAPTYFIFSSSSAVMMVFNSSSTSTGASGWTIHYQTTPSPKPTCGGLYQLSNATGIITDGSATSQYTNNLYCQWLVTPLGAEFIQFTLSNFDTENGKDYVTFYDGASKSSSSVIQKLSGNYLAGVIPPFFSSGNSVLVVFTTDSTNTFNGWSFAYEARNGTHPTCGGRSTTNADNGTIGLNYYTPGLNCQWLVTVSSGIVNITVPFLHTQPDDKVAIYDGTSTTDPLLALLSGDAPITAPILSTSSSVLVSFISSISSPGDTGWTLTWKTSKGIPVSCNGYYHINSSTGTIIDTSTADAVNCQFLITPQGASFIEFYLGSLSIGGADSLIFYDGPNATSPVLQTLSGSIGPNTIPAFYSTGNTAYMEFVTTSTSFNDFWSIDFEARNGTHPTCGGRTVINANSGNISDGSGSNSYSASLNCQWLIQSIDQGVLNISIPYMYTLSIDKVTIYDGSNTSSPILATFSGILAINYFIFSSGNTVLVTFISDPDSFGPGGWTLNWKLAPFPQPTCGGLYQLYATSGTVSDGSPANYTDNLNCHWLIAPSGAQFIQFALLSFDTEYGFDNVTFYDGPNTSCPILQTFSGSYGANLPPFYSTTNKALIVFTTDSSNEANGWSFGFSGKTGAVPTCGGQTVIQADSGSISDGSQNGNYTTGLNCQWLLNVTAGNVLNISVSQLLTQPADEITIYDGPDTTYPALGILSGYTTINYFIFSSSSTVLVSFTSSSSSVGGSGWTLDWQAIPGPQPTCGGLYSVTASSGSISDGHTSPYTDNLNCQWLIYPPGAEFIQFSLSTFDTEMEHDFVTFYDGPSTDSPVIQILSGSMSSGVIPPFFSTGNSVLLVFSTDASNNNGNGWSFNYAAKTGIEPTCGGRSILTSDSGSISDGSNGGNYTAGLNCQWLLNIDSGLFNISVPELNTLPSDKITIYDGPNTTSPVLATLSGTLPITYFIFSSSQTVLISFVTSSASVGGAAGWTLNWQAIPGPQPTCGGVYPVVASDGVISDGNASPYTDNLNCQWLFTPAGGQFIQFEIASFDTELNKDYVTFYDGPNTSSPVIQIFSGSIGLGAIPPFFSTGNTALLVFTTDSNNDNSGWSFNYKGKTGTHPSCGGQVAISENSGSISDGSDSGNYTAGLNCQWLLNIDSGLFNISVPFLDTQSSDVITIYDGPTTNSSVIGILSGNVPITYFIFSSSTSVVVAFSSSSRTSGATGWTLAWESIAGPRPTCGGTYPIPFPSGTVTDGSPQDYTTNLHCQWLVEPTDALSITFIMTFFSTEDGADYVTFYDGPTTASPMLAGPYSGLYSNDSYPTFTSTQGVVLIVFTSDSSDNFPGWSFYYNATLPAPSPSPSSPIAPHCEGCHSGGLSGGTIAAIVVPICVVGIAGGVAGFFLLKRYRKRTQVWSEVNAEFEKEGLLQANNEF